MQVLLSLWRLLIAYGFMVGIVHSSRSLYNANAQVCALSNGSQIVLWQPMGCALLSTSPMVLGFADSRNHVISTIDSAGVTAVLSGNGQKQRNDGAPSVASFWLPYSISTPASDPAPYAIVADYGNRCIRKIQLPGGMVTTIICGGLITSPSDTAVLSNGDIYVANPKSHVILLYRQSDSSIEVAAGSTHNAGMQDGQALTNATFNQPLGLCVHAFTNLVYIADWLNDAVRVFSPTAGLVSTLVAGKGFKDGMFSLAGGVLINGPKMVRYTHHSLFELQLERDTDIFSSSEWWVRSFLQCLIRTTVQSGSLTSSTAIPLPCSVMVPGLL